MLQYLQAITHLTAAAIAAVVLLLSMLTLLPPQKGAEAHVDSWKPPAGIILKADQQVKWALCGLLLKTPTEGTEVEDWKNSLLKKQRMAGNKRSIDDA